MYPLYQQTLRDSLDTVKRNGIREGLAGRLEAVLGSAGRGGVNTGGRRSQGLGSRGAACQEPRWSDQSKAEQHFPSSSLPDPAVWARLMLRVR